MFIFTALPFSLRSNPKVLSKSVFEFELKALILRALYLINKGLSSIDEINSFGTSCSMIPENWNSAKEYQ